MFFRRVRGRVSWNGFKFIFNLCDKFEKPRSWGVNYLIIYPKARSSVRSRYYRRVPISVKPYLPAAYGILGFVRSNLNNMSGARTILLDISTPNSANTLSFSTRITLDTANNRALAVDLVNGQWVILSRGSLSLEGPES